MIPEYDVEMHQRVSTRWIGMPGEEVLGFSEEEDDQGIDTRFLASNHQYEDYRWLDWENVARQITIERYLLEKADTQSKNAQEFEEFCSGVEGKIRDLGDIHEILHFDVGVSALTALTSAMGGAPMNSCRGHTRNKAAPGVAFFTTSKAAKASRLLERKACKADSLTMHPLAVLIIEMDGFKRLSSFVLIISSVSWRSGR